MQTDASSSLQEERQRSLGRAGEDQVESTSGQPSDMPVERIREAEAAVEARDKEVAFGHTVGIGRRGGAGFTLSLRAGNGEFLVSRYWKCVRY